VPPDSQWKHLAGLKVADPEFIIPGPVDALIGADVFEGLMQTGRVIITHGNPTAMETVLGWVVTRQTDNTAQSASVATHLLLVQCNLGNILQKCWALEELPSLKLLMSEEIDC
jgi:hypothetical protein